MRRFYAATIAVLGASVAISGVAAAATTTMTSTTASGTTTTASGTTTTATTATTTTSTTSTTSTTATTVQIGLEGKPLVAPSCPSTLAASACTIILPEVTAVETVRHAITNPTLIAANGELTAFSVGVSQLSANATTRANYLSGGDQTYGGDPEVRLSVLAPIGNPANRRYRVVARSPIYDLTNYLGKVAKFTLTTPLPVVRGEVLGLTVPTWAPVLAISQTPKAAYAYIQSRSSSCSATPTTNLAQIRLGALTSYGCSYTGTRVEYSATEVESTS